MNQWGFTVVEGLIVIAIIAILAAVAFVAIDPAARFAESRNDQRWTDVSLLMEGIQKAFRETNRERSGVLQSIDTDSESVQIITNGSGELPCDGVCGTETIRATACGADLSVLVEQGYLPHVPADPRASGLDSQYFINYDAGMFTVGACAPEQEKDGATPTIRVSR